MAMISKFPTRAASIVLAGVLGSLPQGAAATDLREAVTTAVETNPEIREAIANKQAIEFELDQARGQYLPRGDIEARVGPTLRDSPGTRAATTDDDELSSREINLTVSQTLFDGHAIDSEVERQAYRVDAAALRVRERAEFIGLDAVKAYTQVLRQQKLVGIAKDSLRYHKKKLSEIKSGERSGVLSIADVQQAQERVVAASTTLSQFKEDYEQARITYRGVVGAAPGELTTPASLAAQLPDDVNEAIAIARRENPRMLFANADVGVGYAQYKAAESNFYPKVSFEIGGRAGSDLDGVRGRDNEMSAQLVLRYNLFGGGIDTANRQEQLRRIDQRRSALHTQARDVDELVESTWNTLDRLRTRTVLLEEQEKSAESLLNSYEREFKVGVRSLLDLLNTQNSLVQTRVSLATSRASMSFQEYRALAAMGRLIPSLDIPLPDDAAAYAVGNADAPAVPQSEDQRRTLPWTTTSVLFSGHESH